jgi:hypothetical protein
MAEAEPEVGQGVRQALTDANTAWPKRKKAEDGLLPSEAHKKQNPNSDHDRGDAVDVTVDPKSGASGDTIAAWAIRDPRVTYVIWNHRIYYRNHPGWQDYGETFKSGKKKDQHTEHVHISLRHASRADTSTWGWASGGPTPSIDVPGETTFESAWPPPKKADAEEKPKPAKKAKTTPKSSKKKEASPKGKHVYNGEPSVMLGVKRRMMAHLESPHTGGGAIADGNRTILVGRLQLAASRVGDATTDGLAVKTGQEDVFMT